MEMSDLRGPPKFDTEGNASEISLRWKQWLEEFEAFADCKGLFNTKPANTTDPDTWVNQRSQRRALLLYCGGQRLREIFSSLADTGNADNYDATIKALNTHFSVAVNSTFQRHLFRKMVQEQGETLGQFVGRLRTASVGCDYANVDNEIRDQVVSNCYSDKLRLKLLEKGSDLTLDDALKMASTLETVELQLKEMKVDDSGSVNRASYSSGDGSGDRPQNRGAYSDDRSRSVRQGYSQNSSSRPKCGKCGTSHRPRECPAFGRECFKCHRKNHFRSMCGGSGRGYANVANVASMNDRDQDESLDSGNSFAFCTQTHKVGLERVTLVIGGVDVKFVVDTGADCNIVGKDTWEYLKKRRVTVTRQQKGGGPRIFPYTSDKPMQLVGQFWANVKAVSTCETERGVRFVVIAENAEPLLGIQTATQLGIVRFANMTSTQYETQFPTLFSGGVGKAKNAIKLTIRDDVLPIAQPYRRIPLPMMSKLEEHLKELVELDIIEHVEGPTTWVSPIVIIPKTNDKIRLCVDMRLANTAVVRHHYPVPTVDELLRDMNGAQHFSKIDLKMGFHQFMLHPESRDITTFNTHVGLFRFKRLMFGICSAPEIYQREVADIIRGIPGVSNLADDIVVYGKTQAEHNDRLFETFSRLEAAGMTVNREKCVFNASSIDFLGHRISDKGVDPGMSKVEAVANAEPPKNVMEMKSFLGLVGYCSKFIPFFSDKTDLLRKLTLGKSPSTTITLTDSELAAFKKLKQDLSSCETLAYFNVHNKTLVYADASPVGLGAILVQYQDGTPRVVCYASRALTDVETRYMQTEKEALACVWACERFHHYLFGIHFQLLTDHEALEVIYGKRTKRASLRIERWVLRLQCYDFEVKYVKGVDNIADPLSRLIKVAKGSRGLKQPEALEDTELYVRHTVLNIVSAVTAKDIERASFADEEIRNVRDAIQNKSTEWSSNIPRVYKAISQELCVIGQLLLRGSRIVVPASLRDSMLRLGHEGHLGIVGTKKNLRARVWWPGIDVDVEEFVKRCHGCQLTGIATPRDPIRVTEMPNAPWSDLACDLLGPLPNGENLLVLVDYYSRWYEVKFLTSTTSKKIIDALTDIFDTHGLPVSLKSDNGPQFVSSEFKQFASDMGFEHYLTTPRWPEANGEVERQNRSLMKRIKIAFTEGLDYKTEVRKYIVAYRAVPHTITGKAPSELLFGRKIKTRIPHFSDIHLDDGEWRDRDAEKKHSMVEEKNKGRAPHSVTVGSLVLVKRDNPSKVQTPFHEKPFVVREVCGPMLVLESSAGKIVRRNVHFTRPYFCPTSYVIDSSTRTLEAEKQPNIQPLCPDSVREERKGRANNDVVRSGADIHDEPEQMMHARRPNDRHHIPPSHRQIDSSNQSQNRTIPTDDCTSAEARDSIVNNSPLGPRRSARESKTPQYLDDYVRIAQSQEFANNL